MEAGILKCIPRNVILPFKKSIPVLILAVFLIMLSSSCSKSGSNTAGDISTRGSSSGSHSDGDISTRGSSSGSYSDGDISTAETSAGTMSAANASSDRESVTLTLYFANDNAGGVQAEHRKVKADKSESLEKTVFEELAKGPVTKGLYPVIPKGVAVLSAATSDGTCTLDLSREFVDNNHVGTAGEAMTLNSIVNSLTELPGVKRVRFLIEGKKRDAYLHEIFDQPFERNEEAIVR